MCKNYVYFCKERIRQIKKMTESKVKARAKLYRKKSKSPYYNSYTCTSPLAPFEFRDFSFGGLHIYVPSVTHLGGGIQLVSYNGSEFPSGKINS